METVSWTCLSHKHQPPSKFFQNHQTVPDGTSISLICPFRVRATTALCPRQRTISSCPLPRLLPSEVAVHFSSSSKTYRRLFSQEKRAAMGFACAAAEQSGVLKIIICLAAPTRREG